MNGEEIAPHVVDEPDRGGAMLSGLLPLAAWNALGLVGSSAASLAVLAVAVRRLGPSEYGLFSISLAVTALLGVVDGGLSTAVVRATARELVAATSAAREAMRAQVGSAHAAYVGLAAVALVITVPLAALTPRFMGVPRQRSTAIAVTTLLLGLAVSVQLATAAAQGIAVGHRDYRISSVAAMVTGATTILIALASIDHIGIVGLAIAQLGGVICGRVLLLAAARAHAPWWDAIPRRPRSTDLRRLTVFAAPLVLISAGTQLVDLTDVLVVSAVGSTIAVGLYRVGTVLPTVASSFLFRAADTVFPLLAASDDRNAQERALHLMTALSGYLAGLGFGVMILQRDAIVGLLRGDTSGLAASVLLLFSLIWLSNSIQHGIGLVLIARSRQRRFVALVGVELAANVVLTIVLGRRFGPVGAAWATLATMGASNLLLLPLVVRAEMSLNPFRLVWATGGGAAAVGVIAATAASLLMHSVDPAPVRLALVTLLTATLGIGAGLALARVWGMTDVARRALRTPRKVPSR